MINLRVSRPNAEAQNINETPVSLGIPGVSTKTASNWKCTFTLKCFYTNTKLQQNILEPELNCV